MKVHINKEMVLPHLRHIFTRENPVQCYFGSASSGKSYQIMMMSVLWALQGRTVLIARKEGSQLRRSVWSEVKKAMERMNLDQYFDVQTVLYQYTIKRIDQEMAIVVSRNND